MRCERYIMESTPNDIYSTRIQTWQMASAQNHDASFAVGEPGNHTPSQPRDTKENASQEISSDNSHSGSEIVYLDGMRFWAVCGLLSLMFFLVSMEISVVTTALVSIAEELGDFSDVAWVLSSYLLGYVGLVIIFAKLSDILGRKHVLMFCIFVFTTFSGACGASQTMTQLL